MTHQRFIQFLLLLLPFVFFWQIRYPLFNQYQISDYVIGYLYIRDVVVFLFVVAVVSEDKKGFLTWVHKNKEFVLWVGGLVCISVLSVFSAPLRNIAIYKTLLLGLYSLFAISFGYVLTRYYSGNHRWYLWWIIPFLLIALMGAYEFVLGKSAGFQFLGEWMFSLTTLDIATVTIGTTTFLRPYATFPHPNVLGGVSAIFFTVYLYRWGKQTIRPSVLLAGIAVLWFLVVISFSRSAWLGLIAVLGIYVMKTLQDGARRRMILFVMVSVCIFSLPYFFRLLNNTDPSVVERIELVHQSSVLVSMYPFLGVGQGNYVVALEGVSWDKYPITKQPVHNVWLLAITETGVLGGIWFTLGWVYMLFNAFVNTCQGYKKEIVSLFAIVFVTGLFDHYWWSLPIGQAVFWLVMGYHLAVLQWSSK